MSGERPTRKRARLKGYDYSRPGWYFVTVCTLNRARCLCAIAKTDASIDRVGAAVLSGPQVEFSAYGKVVDRVSSQMPTVEKYMIMPDHVHIMFRIPEPQDGPMGTSAPTLPGLVGYWKRKITRQCGVSLWQRTYHDHIVRDEADYQRVWSYIETNPAKWEEDLYYAP